MVLITGTTGFVGRALLRQLLREGRELCCLIRPSGRDPCLPSGKIHVATSTLHDLSSLRVAMQGVDTVIHLVGAWRDRGADSAEWVNRQGTANVVEAALEAGVRRFVYLSHIHADRNSAYALLRSKGAAEEIIRSSGLRYTILRSSLIFGPDDHFTTVLAMLLKVIPVVFPLVGEGKTRFQPIHVDDAARCLAGCLDAYHLVDTVLRIGGPQHLSYAEVLDAVMEVMRVRRVRVRVRLPAVRTLARVSNLFFPYPPVGNAQIDLFAIDNTTDLGNVPRNFDFEPQRFAASIDYLRRKGWRRAFLRYAYQGRR